MHWAAFTWNQANVRQPTGSHLMMWLHNSVKHGNIMFCHKLSHNWYKKWMILMILSDIYFCCLTTQLNFTSRGIYCLLSNRFHVYTALSLTGHMTLCSPHTRYYYKEKTLGTWILDLVCLRLFCELCLLRLPTYSIKHWICWGKLAYDYANIKIKNTSNSIIAHLDDSTSLR